MKLAAATIARFSLSIFGVLIWLTTHSQAQEPIGAFPKNRPDFNKIVPLKDSPNFHKIELNNSRSPGVWVALKNWNEGNSIVAENDSIVWVGTSVGLVRWNTLTDSYQTFDETNGLNYSSVTSLAFDSQHRLWIGTGQGLVKYTNGTFSFYNHLNSPIPDAGITDLVIDSSDKVYACMDAYVESREWKNGGLVIFDGASWEFVNLPINGWVGAPFAIACYHDTVWVSDYVLYIYTDNGLEKAPGWTFGGTSSMVVDNQDALWTIASHKLIKYFGGEWKVVMDESEHIRGYGSKLAVDPRGGLWLMGASPLHRLDFADREKGRRRCGSWMPLGICPTNVAEAFVDQVFTSSTNQFFVSPNGLFRFNGDSWETFVVPRTLLSNKIYSLGTSPSGEVYLSGELATQKTDGVHWDSVGAQGWLNPPVKFLPDGSFWHDGIAGKYVTGLDFDSYDALWGAYGSVMQYDNSRLRQWLPPDIGIPTRDGYYSAQFMDVAIDRNDNIWACAWYYGGVMFDRTNWHLFPRSDTTLPNYGYDRIFTDSKGRVWFGSYPSSPNYGFTLFEDNQWKTFYSPQRYSISYIYQMAEDHFGNVWLASGGGLLQYDGATFTVFDNTNSRLNTNTVYAVTVDLANNLWVGTQSGLYVYNPAGVKLAPYSDSSPIDSLSILRDGHSALAKFVPQPFSTASAKFELQRGRGTHKFWTLRVQIFFKIVVL